MRKKLSKNEFMSRVINDYYEKRRLKRLNEADVHNIENINKVIDEKVKEER